MPGKMKAPGTLLLVLVISGCTSPQTISFSPAQDYAISIDKEHIDAVRSDTNDITIFRDDKVLGSSELNQYQRIYPQHPDFWKSCDQQLKPMV
jgi:hypothetical protein